MKGSWILPRWHTAALFLLPMPSSVFSTPLLFYPFCRKRGTRLEGRLISSLGLFFAPLTPHVTSFPSFANIFISIIGQFPYMLIHQSEARVIQHGFRWSALSGRHLFLGASHKGLLCQPWLIRGGSRSTEEAQDVSEMLDTGTWRGILSGEEQKGLQSVLNSFQSVALCLRISGNACSSPISERTKDTRNESKEYSDKYNIYKCWQGVFWMQDFRLRRF